MSKITCEVGKQRYRLEYKGSQNIAYHKRELFEAMSGRGKRSVLHQDVQVIPPLEQKWELMVRKLNSVGNQVYEVSHVLQDTALPSKAGLKKEGVVRVTREARCTKRSFDSLEGKPSKRMYATILRLLKESWTPRKNRKLLLEHDASASQTPSR